MRQRFAEDPEVPVVIRGDTQAAYGKVVEVLDVLKGVWSCSANWMPLSVRIVWMR
ncbi:MAG: ExbD/TolR family protein [Sphingobium sp.]